MATGDLITIDDFKSARMIGDGLDDGEIARCITAASYWLSAECGRQFFRDAAATPRKFTPSRHSTVLEVNDFSTTTGLVVVEAGTTLTLDDDFYVAPVNGIGPTGESIAYCQLVKFWGLAWEVDNGGPVVTVTARWGWPAVPAPVKQATIEVVADLMQTRNNTFGVVGIDLGTAVRLRANTHVAAVIKTYERAGWSPRLGLA